MKKVIIPAFIAVLSPSVSHATCTATGTIPRVFVQGSGTSIGVRDNSPGATFFNFTTTSSVFISAAVAAEASHMTVSIVGNAASCSAVSGGLSSGGIVTIINVSP